MPYVGSVVKNLPAIQETQETWVRSLSWEEPLEDSIATHCSILAWAEVPGGPQSIVLQRLGHN